MTPNLPDDPFQVKTHTKLKKSFRHPEIQGIEESEFFGGDK